MGPDERDSNFIKYDAIFFWKTLHSLIRVIHLYESQGKLPAWQQDYGTKKNAEISYSQ